MKQLVVEKNNPEPILWETPVPKPGPGEVLIQNHYSVVSTGTETATIESANKSVAKKIQNSSNILLLNMAILRLNALLNMCHVEFQCREENRCQFCPVVANSKMFQR